MRNKNGQFVKGFKHTEESKKKMSISRKGHFISEETKRKISESEKGKYVSDETGKKISEANKGRKFSEETKRKLRLAKKIKPTWNKGLKLSEEHRKKLSENQWLKGVAGEKHPNWLGGISFEPYGIQFDRKLRKKIRERDNHKCQECNFTEDELGYKLSVHHIDYDKQNNNENNLISLCKSCHGQTNFSRSDWQNYFREKLCV